MEMLRDSCVNAKHNLSTAPTASIATFLPNGKPFRTTIKRSEFNELCKKLFEKTIETVEIAMAAAGTAAHDISEVILVGGSSRIPEIIRMLTNHFGPNITLNRSINPNEAGNY